MLKLNLTRVLTLRGIDQPYAFLVKRGFSRSIASSLVNNRAVNIKISHIETICRALNCTPNDLFEWQADAAEALGENHSLNSLKREKTPARLSRIVSQIPFDKLGQVEDLLNRLKNE